MEQTNKTSEQEKKVGLKIGYYPLKLLGRGRNSRVCEGTFEGKRKVAVKRLDIEEIAYFESETDILCAAGADRHPNIIRYFYSEVKDEFRYIILELCDATLADFVQNHEKTIKFGKVEPIKLLRQCVEGLNFLHQNNIVHRDVKPSNILLKKEGQDVIVKISDFGLGKRIPEGSDDYTNSGNASGTEGWRAPEVVSYNQNQRLTSKVDVWSFGHVIYYVLTGTHFQITEPFNYEGSGLLSHTNYFVTLIPNDFVGIRDLVVNFMTSDEPKERCTMAFVLRHPIFWSSDKILKFFFEVRSFFNKPVENFEVRDTLKMFESSSELFFANYGMRDWSEHLTKRFAEQLQFVSNGEKVFYDGKSIIHLIRALRNKYVHFDELSTEAKEEIGGKSNYISYWLQRFPDLLPHTYRVFSRLRHVDGFQEGGFYPNGVDFNNPGEEILWAKKEMDLVQRYISQPLSQQHDHLYPGIFLQLGNSDFFNPYNM